MHMGASLMVEALAKLERDGLHCRPQPEHGVTYARKIDKAESEIDFSRSAIEVRNHIRPVALSGRLFPARPGEPHLQDQGASVRSGGGSWRARRGDR